MVPKLAGMGKCSESISVPDSKEQLLEAEETHHPGQVEGGQSSLGNLVSIESAAAMLNRRSQAELHQLCNALWTSREGCSGEISGILQEQLVSLDRWRSAANWQEALCFQAHVKHTVRFVMCAVLRHIQDCMASFKGDMQQVRNIKQHVDRRAVVESSHESAAALQDFERRLVLLHFKANKLYTVATDNIAQLDRECEDFSELRQDNISDMKEMRPIPRTQMQALDQMRIIRQQCQQLLKPARHFLIASVRSHVQSTLLAAGSSRASLNADSGALNLIAKDASAIEARARVAKSCRGLSAGSSLGGKAFGTLATVKENQAYNCYSPALRLDTLSDETGTWL